MPRIRCHYLDCVFLDENYCSAAQIELDPDTGCKTYSANVDQASDDNWDEEEMKKNWKNGMKMSMRMKTKTCGAKKTQIPMMFSE